MCAQFAKTSPQLDILNLKGKTLDSKEFEEFIVTLSQFLTDLSRATNNRVIGSYSTVQDLNGKNYWPITAGTNPRSSFAIVNNFGALPNGTISTTKVVAHGINFPAGSIWTHISGIATNTTTGAGIGISHASPTLANNIQLNVDATNITITVDATVDWSAYNNTYIYLEWI